MATVSALAVACGCASGALASDVEIGQVKVARGTVTIERAGAALPVAPGMRLQRSDVVNTGADGSVGITMTDSALLSAGPNSTIAFDRYEFDPTTHAGRLDASLRKGSLAVVSGRIAKQSPEAMTVRTPSAVLGVRGTEFAVRVDDPAFPQR